ncbi:hypothetical protein EPA93_41375 [Ktedonosporobacter rubrisoli]|uniref:Glycosyl hydrolase family 13 catalytic domain-containing protein n=1 Tax=Ktedonosporobacter rubrisoli TaxID=2509675 RepID=A0A4P6K1V2_KTERU|nr:alpha-amylase family glycosyl hydrolase [Ktedonosporobacter rubrisoli]QBD82089.1 hypothetical protein EPA93_41375 [Ktedonosporobacter rubrisoli]
MTEVVDFFFGPYPYAQQLRLKAAIEDGLAHGSRIEPHDPQPGETVTLFFSTNAQKPIEQVAVYYTADGTTPRGSRGEAANGKVVLAEVEQHEPGTTGDQSIRPWRAVLPPQAENTLVRYCADAWNKTDPSQHWYADWVDPVSMPGPQERIFAYHVDCRSVPQWWQEAVVYHIFVDRFNAGSHEPPLRSHEHTAITDFFGGTLTGIIEKLDYIHSLGTNCIWLSPVFESPVYHGYNISDYFNVARRYGTNETLRRLIQEAHQRGIRVLLDFVANHTSDQHPAFIAGKANPASDTAHWYAFGDWPPYGYRTYALVQNMPELMTEHADVRRYLINAALHWLSYFGADGMRLDYVAGPSHSFWTEFQEGLKERFPQALTLGEITASLTEIADYEGRLDAFMDFPLTGMLRKVFALREAPLTSLLSFLDERVASLPAHMERATLLDNHDMHRFLWLAHGQTERLKLAAVCHLTLDGTPIVYYGTEVGLSQYADASKENAYARAPMLWDEYQDTTLLAHYRRLIAIRQAYPALRTGTFRRLSVQLVGTSAAADEQIGAYLRQSGEQYVLIALNNNELPVKMRIILPAEIAEATGTLCNLLPSTRAEPTWQENLLELELAGLAAAILLPGTELGKLKLDS